MGEIRPVLTTASCPGIIPIDNLKAGPRSGKGGRGR